MAICGEDDGCLAAELGTVIHDVEENLPENSGENLPFGVGIGDGLAEFSIIDVCEKILHRFLFCLPAIVKGITCGELIFAEEGARGDVVLAAHAPYPLGAEQVEECAA